MDRESDSLVSSNLAFYRTIKPKTSDGSYTVIATINDYDNKKLIALATGTQANLKDYPYDIEDCHAESLVKRAFKRYIIDLIKHVVSNSSSKADAGSIVRKTIPTNLILFVSQFPCGVLKRYEGDDIIIQGGQVERKPGRGTLRDGKIIYVEKDTCARKLHKWSRIGLQGHKLKSIFNIESKLKQILIGNCEVDENLDCRAYVEQFKRLIQADDNSIDVDLLDYIRQDEFIFNPSKQATPEALVWWASVSNEKVERPRESKQVVASNGNIEYIVNGRRRGLTKRQVSLIRNTNQQLSISTIRLREDLSFIEHLLDEGPTRHA